MFIIVLEQHFSILIESSSGPSKKTEENRSVHKMFKNALWDPKFSIKLCIKCMCRFAKAKRHMHFIHSFINSLLLYVQS